jgi:hypothetical protein
MRRQLLHPVGTLGLLETVAATVGAQAQVQSSAELGIALRRRHGRVGDAASAVADGTVMRTWAMRGTLHLLQPAQAGALLALLSTSRRWERPSWRKAFGVGPRELEQLIEAARDALEDRVLEREELIEEIAERTGSRDLEEHLRSGWGGLLKPLAWMGHLCNGPSRGGRVTFTRPDTWLAGWQGLPPADEAARTVITSYLRSYGPATMKTFHAWLAREACKSSDVRHWFEQLDSSLAAVQVDGETRFALAEDLDELRDTRPARGIRLLSGFDQYLLGPGTSDIGIVPAHRRADVSRTAGWISPVVLDAGRVAGVWKLDGGVLLVSLFAESRELDARALARETERIGAAVGRQLRLSMARL